MRFSPYYAEEVIIPYIKDMVRNLKLKAESEETTEDQAAQIVDDIEMLENQINDITYALAPAKQHIVEVEADKKSKLSALPKDRRYGAVSGLPVSKDVASLVKSQFVIVNDPEMLADKIDTAGSKLLAYFKWAKVPAQLFAYPRNLASNLAQWTMSGADPASFPFHYARAIGSMLSQYDKVSKKNSKWYDLARSKGVLNTNMVTAEIAEGLEAIQESFSAEGKKKRALVVKGMQLIGDAYGVIDDVAKLARIRYAMEVQGKTEDEAVDIAQEAHYNYALTYDIIRAIRDPKLTRGVVTKLVSTLFPTYTQKTISFVVETIIKRPATFVMIQTALLMYLKGDDDEEREKIGAADWDRVYELIPDWAKNNPFMKVDMERTVDGSIDVILTDLGYIIPYGGLAKAGQAIIDSMKGEGIMRLAEGAGELGVGGSPLQMVGDLVNNKDSFTGKPIYYKHDSVQATKDVAHYLSKQLGPGSITKTISLMEGRHPVVPRLFGINVYVYNEKDLENMREGQAKKAAAEAGLRGGKYKRQITDAKVKFDKKEITLEERNEKIAEAEEEVAYWKNLGAEAFEDISGKSADAKGYGAEARKVRSAYTEYKRLGRQAGKNKARFGDYKRFKADKEKMTLVNKKKLVNKIDQRLSKIKRALDNIEYSSKSDKEKVIESKKLRRIRVDLLKKASKLIK
jgi:hypothetical protein